MSQKNDKARLLWFGDLVNPTGFGRIGNEITRRLVLRGWPVLGLSVPWNGYPLNPLLLPVIPMGGIDIWNRLAHVVHQEKPDVVVVCQDFPYAQTAFHGCRIDWSQHRFMTVTPIDGTPIHPEWLRMVDLGDATLVISRFGVEAMRLAGKRVDLLHPGVDTGEFYPARPGEAAAARAKLNIPPDAFVLGMFAMNQGRKCISMTVAAFLEFARDKPDAYLYLDMDKASPAGWDVPTLCAQLDPHGEVLTPQRVLFREQAVEPLQDGQTAPPRMALRDRYLLCDVNSVVSHREGFGLPLLEGMACGVVGMALDWCSGPEIVGEGRGALVRRLDYMEYGTWGHARDAFPDMQNWIGQLNRLYDQPGERLALAERGRQWAVEQTWDAAADQFEAALKRVLETEPKSHDPSQKWYIPAPQFGDNAGVSEPVSDRPGVRSTADGAAMPAIPGDDVRSHPDGGAGPGRPQPGLQPAGNPPHAGRETGPQPD